MSENQEKSVLRPVDDEARSQAVRLLREARHASLASLQPETGHPIASRVIMANRMDGTPIILISDLSAHTPALKADQRCSLLIGDIGRGDPLSHPRMTLQCTAKLIERDGEDQGRARSRFLRRHKSAELYVDFADFHFFVLNIEHVSLNGGFAKAYSMEASDILLSEDTIDHDFHEAEADIVEHMNADHKDSIQDYARFAGELEGAPPFQMTGIDPAGIDLINKEKTLRIDFTRPLQNVDEVRPMLVSMAKKARRELSG